MMWIYSVRALMAGSGDLVKRVEIAAATEHDAALAYCGGEPCLDVTQVTVGTGGDSVFVARGLRLIVRNTWRPGPIAAPTTGAVANEGETTMSSNDTVYVVRDAAGEYVGDTSADRRTPASNEAQEFSTREEAEAACTRVTDRVLSREVE